MVRIGEDKLCAALRSKALSLILTLGLILSGMFGIVLSTADAAASTVTLKYGSDITYGSGWTGHTTMKWVTHVNGEVLDLDDEPGVSRSYAYCVQPPVGSPPQGTYSVSLVDDDDTGKISKMRKIIYYLPGSYGYAKLTKNRWFSGTSLNDAYVMGHLALSWVYDGYSESQDIWGGAPSSMVSKVRSMVDDLSNIPDPPEDYEVFWVRVSGMQDVFGAFYKDEYGNANVKKDSANTQISSGNSCYSIEGAEYTLYTDSGCTEVAKTRNGADAVIRIKANGDSDPVEVKTGTYFFKETKAPRGYALDTKAHAIEVIKDKTSTFSAHDIPKSNETGLLIQKLDKETGLSIPQGGASLAGAEYTVKYYDVYPKDKMTEAEMASAVSSRTAARIGNKEASWVFKTDEQGRIDMSQPDRYLIREKSADLYRNSNGKPAFPIGIISVQETKAPEGYLIDKTVRYASITDGGNVENLSSLKTFTGDRGLKEQVIRGDLSLKKAAEGRKRMAGIEFSFTSLTNGEKHVLVTDKNGYLNSSSSWNPHDANVGEEASPENGIWFNGYNDEKTGAKPDNKLGALPYDRYLMEEIRSDANKGYELISDEITIERAGFVLDLGTYDDAKEPVPELGTNARDAKTDSSTASTDKEIIIIDSVDYRGLKPGRTYVVEGILMDKETEKPLLDDKGQEIRGSAEFYAEKEKGSTEVVFTFSGESLGGKTAVVFEYLKLEGELIAEHTDIKSREQTVNIVEIEKVKGTFKKEKPEQPEEPEIPEVPEEPEEPSKRRSPDTGDPRSLNLLYYLTALSVAAEGLLLTTKRRNDRLN